MEINHETLALNGWEVESEAPLVIRHLETGSLATRLAAEIVMQNLGDAQAGAVRQLLELNERVDRLVDVAYSSSAPGTLGWSTAYGLIFNPDVSGRIHTLLERLKSPLDYYDPDCDYEDDVRAFHRALKDKVALLSPFFVGAVC